MVGASLILLLVVVGGVESVLVLTDQAASQGIIFILITTVNVVESRLRAKDGPIKCGVSQ